MKCWRYHVRRRRLNSLRQPHLVWWFRNPPGWVLSAPLGQSCRNQYITQPRKGSYVIRVPSYRPSVSSICSPTTVTVIFRSRTSHTAPSTLSPVLKETRIGTSPARSGQKNRKDKKMLCQLEKLCPKTWWQMNEDGPGRFKAFYLECGEAIPTPSSPWIANRAKQSNSSMPNIHFRIDKCRWWSRNSLKKSLGELQLVTFRFFIQGQLCSTRRRRAGRALSVNDVLTIAMTTR